MSNTIEANEIAGGAVYGVKQYDYTVDGASGRSYADALAAASFKESVSIETLAAGYAEVVRQRSRKVEDLGDVLAVLARAIATMDPKSNDTGKMSGEDDNLVTARATCAKYGITLEISGNRISYRNAVTGQNNIQYALDIEDNNLQQDNVALQSYLSKRDNAFSTAAKIIKKATNTASSTLSNIAG